MALREIDFDAIQERFNKRMRMAKNKKNCPFPAKLNNGRKKPSPIYDKTVQEDEK